MPEDLGDRVGIGGASNFHCFPKSIMADTFLTPSFIPGVKEASSSPSRKRIAGHLQTDEIRISDKSPRLNISFSGTQTLFLLFLPVPTFALWLPPLIHSHSSFWFLIDKMLDTPRGQDRNWRRIELSQLAEDYNGGYFPDTFVYSWSKRGIVSVTSLSMTRDFNGFTT
ncbi:hypothetical protein CDAR_84911 [Caerostris darwini]|uniref:NADH-plastoquinone oxidoreductase subunit 5 n=1 Tax=Caerostris darwini TaxID=1538125 RepID=A0AAV4PKD1_9ARAC|nr:hypothetical protein CDAR_84911 [Caerostris darwini]